MTTNDNHVEVKIDTTSDLLIIDFSYYMIYRYHALQAWFKHSETEMNEGLFLTKYNLLFVSNLNKIIKKLKIKTLSNVILVGDCSRKNIWRCEIYDQYKGERDKYWENNPINPMVFDAINSLILPELTNVIGYQHLCMDTMEADDIAYTIISKLRKEKATPFEKHIYVVTNDNDYLQLMSANTDIVNLPSLKSIAHRGIDNCPVKSLCQKILCGDSSDNISGIVSSKVASRLVQDIDVEQPMDVVWTTIMNKLKNEKKAKICADWEEQLNLNKKLIDMSNIPQHLQDSIQLTFVS